MYFIGCLRVLNNLPVDVARAMGADYVIAVDLTVNNHLDRKDRLQELLGINADSIFLAKGKFTPMNILNWGVFRPDLTQYKVNRADADVYIHPDLTGYRPQDFTSKDIDRMISIGEKAAIEALPQLKVLRDKVIRPTYDH